MGEGAIGWCWSRVVLWRCRCRSCKLPLLPAHPEASTSNPSLHPSPASRRDANSRQVGPLGSSIPGPFPAAAGKGRFVSGGSGRCREGTRRGPLRSRASSPPRPPVFIPSCGAKACGTTLKIRGELPAARGTTPNPRPLPPCDGGRGDRVVLVAGGVVEVCGGSAPSLRSHVSSLESPHGAYRLITNACRAVPVLPALSVKRT